MELPDEFREQNPSWSFGNDPFGGYNSRKESKWGVSDFFSTLYENAGHPMGPVVIAVVVVCIFHFRERILLLLEGFGCSFMDSVRDHDWAMPSHDSDEQIPVLVSNDSHDEDDKENHIAASNTCTAYDGEVVASRKQVFLNRLEPAFRSPHLYPTDWLTFHPKLGVVSKAQAESYDAGLHRCNSRGKENTASPCSVVVEASSKNHSQDHQEKQQSKQENAQDLFEVPLVSEDEGMRSVVASSASSSAPLRVS